MSGLQGRACGYHPIAGFRYGEHTPACRGKVGDGSKETAGQCPAVSCSRAFPVLIESLEMLLT
ncbi:MAG TPA: hypothetical protein VN150_09970, partial [Ochrobactrum sp.]|nr:hypothetical protein [Ochrobactrum sp.]